MPYEISKLTPAAIGSSFNAATKDGNSGAVVVSHIFIRMLDKVSDFPIFMKRFQHSPSEFADLCNGLTADSTYYLLEMKNLFVGIQGHEQMIEILRGAFLQNLPVIKEDLSKPSSTMSDKVPINGWAVFLERCKKLQLQIVLDVANQLWPEPAPEVQEVRAGPFIPQTGLSVAMTHCELA